MNGYVKIFRKMLDNPTIMKDADHIAVWIYLLLNASHKEFKAIFKGKEIILKPGQLIVGNKSIGEKLKINYMKSYRILNEYKSVKQIEIQTSNKNSLITILNWEHYQEIEKQNVIQLKNNCNSTVNKQEYKEIYNTTNNIKKNARVRKQNEKNLIEFIEIEFGRTINSSEAEIIYSWPDNELTRYAIKQAVINQAFNVRYISKILWNYNKQGIKNVSMAKKNDQRFIEEDNKFNFINDSILNYDWLNEEKGE